MNSKRETSFVQNAFSLIPVVSRNIKYLDTLLTITNRVCDLLLYTKKEQAKKSNRFLETNDDNSIHFPKQCQPHRR